MSIGQGIRRVLLLSVPLMLVGATLPATAVESADRDRFSATGLQPTDTIVGDMSKAARTKDGRVSVVVKLDDASVAAYTGGVDGLAATNPEARGEEELDLDSKETKAYRSYLRGKQDKFRRDLDARVDDAQSITHVDLVLNAVTVVLPPEEVTALAAVPGVQAIYPDVLLTVNTDASPAFIGATSAWQSLGGQEAAGEGVIVGVLDSGVWPEHPSFADPDPSGKAYPAPPAAPDGSRACDFTGGVNPGDPFTCNNKLIGAERVMSTYEAVIGVGPGEFTTARDDDGHGTHTASTAAGNGGVAASIFGEPRGTVSGIAPRAHVEVFKVCGVAGCFSSDSAAAVERAITDGVNVINFSVSGGSSPFSDPVELAFLDAYEAGVFVAASAGNSGPTPDTTDHRGPWVTTVAASTHDRGFVNTVNLTADGAVSLSLAGTSLTAGVGPAQVVVPAADPLCLNPAANPGEWTDKIVVCKRGGNGRVQKGSNVAEGGGVGMILYNTDATVTDLETDNHFVPTSHIQFSQGEEVLAFVAGNADATATITPGVKGSAQGDVMASFSSRGGPGQTLGISKPDITAPGVQILAGNSPEHVEVAGGPQGELFQAIAGTSMSSPQVAGSGALLKALHPTWTPGQIKSALMTTARTQGLVKEDGVTPFTPFDAGSGRVDLTVAGDPGLTFASTAADFLANSSALYNANYPSIYYPKMPGVVTVSRTATSVLDSTSVWRLKATGTADFRISVPSSLTVRAGRSVRIPVTLDASRVPLGQTRFGTITLTQSNRGNRVLHMPVTIVRDQASVTFTKACAPTDLIRKATTSCTLTATNATSTEVDYAIRDALPSQLDLVRSSVVGGTARGNTVVASGSLAAAQPPQVSIADGTSPTGYLPLSLFGIAPITGVDDETISNFDVPAFSFGGETWTRLGVVSNGYAVIGGGTGADVNFINQNLPNPESPNNVLAGFWTDLNPAAGGNIRVGTLTDGVDTWIVVDFEDVPEYSGGGTHSFQIWIGTDSGTPDEDITFTYGTNTGTGDAGFATVGAENKLGNSGGNFYVDGVGTLPTSDTELRVSSTPGVTQSAVVTFDARAKGKRGPWTNCATLQSSGFQGTSYSCATGTIQ